MVNALFLPLGLFLSSIERRSQSRTTSIYGASSAAESLPSPIFDSTGAEVSNDDLTEKLQNKRVALYFSAGWCPMCTSFEPSLLQFRQAAEDSGKPIELIYVGSERSADDQSRRSSDLNMLNVPFDDTAELKQKYKIWAGSEALKFGFGRRSGVPAIVVLDNTGNELAFVAAEAQGAKALGSWPLDEDSGIWLN